MKKYTLFKKVIVIVITLLTTIISVSCDSNNDSDLTYLVEEESWFEDFQIIDDSVVFICHLAIQNTQDQNLTIRIYGDFSEDFKTGLVTDDTLQAVSKEDSTISQFSIQPGRTQLDVAFVGTHGPYDYKQDRLLPIIKIATVK